MAKSAEQEKTSGYDRYINWRLFAIPVVALFILVLMPTPKSMVDVGVEYAYGPKYMENFLAEELFHKTAETLIPWQIQLIRMMVTSVQQSSFSLSAFQKKGENWCKNNAIQTTPGQLQKVRSFVEELPPDRFVSLLQEAHAVKTKKLGIEDLTDSEKEKAKKAGFKVKIAVGIVVFVVLCFVTEALPLPMVAFCIGIIALLGGIVNREEVAGLYWSDATWFIMGSLMFATAFIKTGVDRRIAMMMFGRLKNPDVKWITLIIILIIAPLTMFMSDHALAAMFLPIGILLYTTASDAAGSEDPELAKMLMISIAMACNLGGSLAPSGAARNIIMMGYAEEMFGVQMGFGQWCIYCIPFLIFVIPITWAMINWRFKPAIRNLNKGFTIVKEQSAKLGDKWTKDQKMAVVIFAVMLFCWITEKNLLVKLTGIRFGIGVLAVMGALAYILSGIVNWRDYQSKVDWGVVWLYAGAIIFGSVLVETGGAYWIARSLISFTLPLGIGEGLGLLLTGNTITALLTQLMADGPACAAVGPVTLAMAGIVHPGTDMIPFMAMGTAIASSFAYCLVIGTPPNAIVYASGYLKAKDYLRVGIILWITNMIGLAILSGVYWRLLGWSGLIPY